MATMSQREMAKLAGFDSPYNYFLDLIKKRKMDELMEFVDTLSDEERANYADEVLNTNFDVLFRYDILQMIGILIEMGGQPTQHLLDGLNKYKSELVHYFRVFITSHQNIPSMERYAQEKVEYIKVINEAINVVKLFIKTHKNN